MCVSLYTVISPTPEVITNELPPSTMSLHLFFFFLHLKHIVKKCFYLKHFCEWILLVSQFTTCGNCPCSCESCQHHKHGEILRLCWNNRGINTGCHWDTGLGIVSTQAVLFSNCLNWAGYFEWNTYRERNSLSSEKPFYLDPDRQQNLWCDKWHLTPRKEHTLKKKLISLTDL